MPAPIMEVEGPADSDVPRTGSARRDGGTAAMWWGAAGVALLFASAAFRLGERGIGTVADGLSTIQWFVLGALTAVFVYGEGVRALERKYVPHVMRRLELLRGERRAWYAMLAPLHALTLIGAARPALLRAWAGTIAIILAVLLVRTFPEPWRGITDFAVAAALAWGTWALGSAALRQLR